MFAYILFVFEREHEHVISNSAIDWGSYAAAFYFISVTMSTLGYGEILPETALGRGAAVASCLVGVILLGFLFMVVAVSGVH